MTNQEETDALELIENINNVGLDNNELLIKINTDLSNINEHVSSLDDYLVIQKKEKEKNEQETKETNEKETSENQEQQKNGETRETSYSIDDVYTEVAEVNEHLGNIETLQTMTVFSNGIIIGVLLLTIFWQRFLK